MTDNRVQGADVRGHANDAACDLQMYMRVVVPGYDTSHTDSLIETMQSDP